MGDGSERNGSPAKSPDRSLAAPHEHITGLAIGSLRSAPSTFTLASPSLDPDLAWLGSATPARSLGTSPGLPPPRASAAAQRAAARPGHILEITPVGPSVRIFRVARPPSFSFNAGQSLKLGTTQSSVRRRYSIASAPHEPHLEFCIESVPGGLLTSHLFELAPGAPLTLADTAKGSFALEPNRRRHVMVGTVTGIAPLRSMLRETLFASATLATSEFWLLHGASYADELPYLDELSALASQDPRVHYTPSVSRPWAARNQGWTGHHGRVDSLVLPTLRALGSKQDVAVYACGHPEMVRSVRETLEPLGYLVLDEAYD